MTYLSFVLSLLLAMPVAFAAPADQGLDINDVAVLFPLDDLAQPRPEIRLSRDYGDFISTEVYNQVLSAARSTGITALLFQNFKSPAVWAVVAYRIDPCAPRGHDAPGGACAAELRLILQPSGSFGGPMDSALHLVYDIEQQASVVYQSLRSLKTDGESSTFVATAGRPLGVHPQLKAALGWPADQSFPKRHAAFLREFATSARLKKVTIMGLRNDRALDWVFLGGNVASNRWTQDVVPNLPKDKEAFIEFDRSEDSSFLTKPVDPSLSTFAFFDPIESQDARAVSVLNEAVHRLENPELSNRNTSDCVSCHSATNVRIHPLSTAPLFTPSLSGATPEGITGFPDVGVLPSDDDLWNLRAFGYFDEKPTVAMRTVLEAAGSANRINQDEGWKNPGASCENGIVEALSCFVLSSTGRGAGKTMEECLQICKP